MIHSTASFMKFLCLLALPISVLSCGSYHMGNAKPASLANVRLIAVPMFKNATQHPRAEAIATSAAANALIQDGTYRLAQTDRADAILEGELKSIEYSIIRGTRLDTLLPEELSNKVTIEWTLRDAKDPTKVLASGKSTGRSQLFAGSNLQTSRNNALPEALERAGGAMISRLANGF